jgi:hypothetical protein
MIARWLVVLLSLLAILAARSAHAQTEDAHRYALRDGRIVVDDRADEATAVDCKETFALARVGDYLYVACGAEGAATYALSDPLHPALTGRVVTPCATFSSDGACMASAPPPAAPLVVVHDTSTVLVHLDVEGASLFHAGDDRRAPAICTGPCDMQLPRDGWYYARVGHAKTEPFTLSLVRSPRARVALHRESVSRALGAGIVIGSTLVAGVAFEAAAIALRTDTSCGGSSWFCIPGAAFAPIFDVLAGMVVVGGTAGGIAMLASPKQKLVASVIDGDEPPAQPLARTSHVQWRPTFVATPSGASLGLRATF